MVPPKCWEAPGVAKAVAAFDTKLVAKLKSQPWCAESGESRLRVGFNRPVE